MTLVKIISCCCLLLFHLAQTTHCLKITLFDSSKIREDLNWYKLSFKENPSSLHYENTLEKLTNGGKSAYAGGANTLQTISNTRNSDFYGWKESSFALQNGDDIWRIHFVCDLNVQNIQNWLFTPLISTKNANRVTLNLTFTIRECEQFPIKQIAKNCREKFELYYEEMGRGERDMVDAATSSSVNAAAADNNSTAYFMTKIKELRFRDTFVSSADSGAAGLRYYNSVVDRQKHMRNLRGNSASDSFINVELREIPLSYNNGINPDSYIRFAIRDTGACISLLGVQVSYTSCPAFTKHGIQFEETPTGRDLTDLVQVNGKCPPFSSEPVGQIPKAICTAKGEWLITDLNLANRCQCVPGYQFMQDKCIPCSIGTYKLSTSNDDRCITCPHNSWSNGPGSTNCQCLSNHYRENESDLSSSCMPIHKIGSNHLEIAFINEEKLNISINRAALGLSQSNIKTELKCYSCISRSYSFYYRDECDQSCFISSSSSNWMVILNKSSNSKNNKIKLVAKQDLNGHELSKSTIYLSLNEQEKQIDALAALNPKEKILCEFKEAELDSMNTNTLLFKALGVMPKPTQHRIKSTCFNISINFPHELASLFSQHDLIEKIRANRLISFNIYAFVVSSDYHLIPASAGEHQIQNDLYKKQLNSNKNYVKLDGIESNEHLKNLILNGSFYSFLVCNNLDEIEKLKIELRFKCDESLGDQVDDKLEVYLIDLKMFDLCFKNTMNSKLIRQYGSGIDSFSGGNQSLMSLKNSLSERSLNSNNGSSTSNFKVHVLLPITLSFLLVMIFIMFALFIRRFRFNAKSAEKDYDCEKHMKKFMPVLTKSCSNKCINCTSQNTSSSSSSSSTSSRMSSTSPSTTCTTSSQILEHNRNSKLYYVDPHTYEDPALAIQEFAQEISPLDIKIESVIGGGEFGDVCKGKLKNSGQNWITVAIKTLKVGSSEKNRCDFLTEASIMAQFHHDNIICLEGVVTQSNPLMIITEYMDNGSLDTFLRLNSWRLDIYDLINMLRDIASGMRYLSEMNFVHRDLAARNILVNKDLKCKVADFGLSREIEGTTTEGVYWTKGGKIPVRWTAPEAISHTKFTCSSDVWSFGVVAWEVMSYGERPYWNWSNTDVIKSVEKGFRLLIPPNCPQIIYNLMLDCWESDRLKRPRFRQIVNELDLILKSKSECLYAKVKYLKQASYIDTNRPNFTQLTNTQEWLNSLGIGEYISKFHAKRYFNLSQVINLELNDLVKNFEICNETHQCLIIESLKRIQFELNFQNGFLV